MQNKIRFTFLLLTLWSTFICYAFSASKLPNRAKLIGAIAYKQTPQGPQLLDVYIPDSSNHQPTPVMVFIHGGSWMHGNRKELNGGTFQHRMLIELLRKGYSVVSIDYRLAADGSNVCYPGPLSDCRDAIRWVRKSAKTYAFDTSRIAVSGTSAGGHLALLTAYAPSQMAQGDPSLQPYSASVKCCVDFYGPTYLVKMLYPTLFPLWVAGGNLVMPKLTKMRNTLLTSFSGYSSAHPYKRRKACKTYSPIYYCSTAVPTIVFHGNKDKTVSFKQTQRLQKHLKAQGRYLEVHTIENEDHCFPKMNEAGATEMINSMWHFLENYNK